MKEETKSDWIDSGEYLPGEHFIGEYLLVQDNNGVQVIRWINRNFNTLAGDSKWKKLPEGYCTECGAGPKKKGK